MAQIKNQTTLATCSWSHQHPDYMHYHDTEWGIPVYDERAMFESLILESFQAGLSWWTILQKRENFRAAFDNFDAHKIASYSDDKVEQLLSNPGIIRHRGKIEATINNAQMYLQLRNEGKGLVDTLWSYVDHQPIINQWTDLSQVPAKTQLSDTLSKDLKKLGFKFVGSTTLYAHLQAVGIVNDHLTTCPYHPSNQKP